MTDLPIFVGIVTFGIVGGIVVGMIVAGRIDRVLTPPPPAPPVAGPPDETAVGIEAPDDEAGEEQP